MAVATERMPPAGIGIRPAGKADLDAINRVIKAAVMSWRLPERVRRLALPAYRYSDFDLECLEAVVATDMRGQIIGVATWEETTGADVPAGSVALQLHGIHVHPACHGRGIGRRLFRTAETAVHRQHCAGLLVRAQRDACGFFVALGMQRLVVERPGRDYAHRFWKPAGQPGTQDSAARPVEYPPSGDGAIPGQ